MKQRKPQAILFLEAVISTIRISTVKQCLMLILSAPKPMCWAISRAVQPCLISRHSTPQVMMMAHTRRQSSPKKRLH